MIGFQRSRARLARRLLVVALAFPVAGCALSQIASPFSSKPRSERAAAEVSEGRLLEAARTDTSGQVDMVSVATNCPTFDVWPRDKMLTVYDIGQVGDSLAIRHRGEITKTARECRVSPDRVVVKYGVAGRVLLGPRGAPGEIVLPLLVHVTDRTRNILNSHKITVSARIDPADPVAYFSAVREVPIPVAPGTMPGDYSVFIAFDRSAPGAG